VSDFRAFQNRVMLEMYRSWLNGSGLVSIGRVLKEAGVEWERGWLVRVHESLKQEGYLEGPANRRNEEMTAGALTPRGLLYVEEHILPKEQIDQKTPGAFQSDAFQTDAFQTEAISAQDRAEAVVVPASDRIVRFDHNQPEYVEIAKGLISVREAVRELNDSSVDNDERQRILASFDSAQALWKSLNLKVIQLKVGILMTLEDAVHFLGTTAKAVVAALLVDTFKAFVKNHVGIDLDAI
jgi:hypothetical protein